jgi:peptidoglycan/xylan/chitin deacetylase (PgdA/CDA1 family)
MPSLKKVAKLLLSYAAFPYVNKNNSKSSKNRGCIFPLILHDVPRHQTVYLKELLIQLKKEYNFLDPEDFISVIRGNLNITDTHRLLTFDDGFYSNYSFAKEVLGPLGIKAIFFIPTGFIDSNSKELHKEFIRQNLYEGQYPSNSDTDEMKPMTWENLSELVELGHIIGAHTKNHLRLSEINEENLLKEEIIASGDRIEEILKIKVEHFAFPFGDIESIDKKALELASTRYKYIYSGLRGRNSYGTNPFAIRRESLDIGDSYEYNRFVAGGGLSFFYWRARRRLDAMIS